MSMWREARGVCLPNEHQSFPLLAPQTVRLRLLNYYREVYLSIDNKSKDVESGNLLHGASGANRIRPIIR